MKKELQSGRRKQVEQKQINEKTKVTRLMGLGVPKELPLEHPPQKVDDETGHASALKRSGGYIYHKHS